MLRFSEQEIRVSLVLTTCLTPPPTVNGPWDYEAQRNMATQIPPLPLPERLVFCPVLLLHQHSRLSFSPALLLILNLLQRHAFLTKKKGKRWGRKSVSRSLLSLPLPVVLLLSLLSGSSSIHSCSPIVEPSRHANTSQTVPLQ